MSDQSKELVADRRQFDAHVARDLGLPLCPVRFDSLPVYEIDVDTVYR